MSIKIHVEIDLTTAKAIYLDFINDDGTASITAEYSSGAKQYLISFKQLQEMAEHSSFKWLVNDCLSELKEVQID
jgi:hypothetical protein